MVVVFLQLMTFKKKKNHQFSREKGKEGEEDGNYAAESLEEGARK